MRLFLIVPAVCLILSLERAAPAQQPSEIIDKAIKAHGGQDKLAKLKDAPIQVKAKGTIHKMGLSIDITMETSVQDKKFKRLTEGEVMGMKFTQTEGYDGKKFWSRVHINGMDTDVPLDDDKIQEEIKEQMYQESVAALTIFKDKKLELSPLGEVQINDKPALGIRVSSKGHRDVSLFFDKQKGLLVKTEIRALDLESKKEVTQEKLLSDYKEWEGMQSPTKVVVLQEGKKLLEMDITEKKLVNKLDDSVFTKP